MSVKKRRITKMKRKIKIGSYWLTVENLETLKRLLEIQETTDKDMKGGYIFSDEKNEYYYRIDEEYDVILEEIRR